MKENVFDVLMYLFENYMEEGPDFNPDQETLAHELAQAGFPHREISQAFSWLDGLSFMRGKDAGMIQDSRPGSLRHYSYDERERINIDCRGFLLLLEQNGVLSANMRELIIDRIMALEVEEVDLENLKWIILMVLFNQPGLEQSYAMIEDMVYDEMRGHVQ